MHIPSFVYINLESYAKNNIKIVILLLILKTLHDL